MKPFPSLVPRHFVAVLTLIAGMVLCFSCSEARADDGGLQGVYSWSNGSLVRIDGTVDFNWGSGSPARSAPSDNFSVSWSAQVLPPVTGNYTFYTESDDGVRLWVNGQLVIDNWPSHTDTINQSAAISLTAGQRYNIRMDYYETTGQAIARLMWSYPGQARQVIPRSRFLLPFNPAPVSLSANGVWTNSCAVCNGMPMAHVVLSWQAASGTSPISYNIYRNGVRYKVGVTSPSYTDMGVVSGQAYSYQVTEVTNTSRESAASSTATATAPFPPAYTAPSNVYIQGTWLSATNQPTDVLSWEAVSGAASYNIYLYNQLIATGIKGTTFTVPASKFFAGMTYTITSVDSMGMETLPSAPITAQGAPDPRYQPSWMPNPPAAPINVSAVGEWNAGVPRIHVTWQGNDASYTYNVYRDGVKVASGIFGLSWFDNNVKVGETHAYAISGVNVPWKTTVEGPRSVSASGTAPRGAPALLSQKVQITSLTPNDDSVLVTFSAVPGAVDYRCYDTSAPNKVKYSGGGLSIEMNGFNPAVRPTLVVEAVDKFGPFQTMDGSMGPGSMNGMQASTNGLGDPSNVPNILAASDPITVTFTPRGLTGQQVFFETFRNSQPLVTAAVPVQLAQANDGWVSAVENDRWTIYNVLGDLATSRAFIMNNHLMDTLYDGGTPGLDSNPLHNNNASMVLQPKATADLTGGKVLHVTFEVDAHFDSRRWVDVFVTGAGDPLLNPGKFAENNLMPTVSGQVFRWEIHHNVHSAQIFAGKDASGNLIATQLFDQANGVGPDNFGPPARITWDGIPVQNGTISSLDLRHKFDLYLSRSRFVVYENGQLIKDKVFPNNQTLPFTKMAVYFIHEVYHTGNDRPELVNYYPSEIYWINNRPWADERHWDNIGFEVVDFFPFTGGISRGQIVTGQ